MKSSLLPLASLALLPACSSMSHDSQSMVTPAEARSRASSTRVIPYEIERATLDNGLKVVMLPMKSNGLVAYWSVVRTGSRDEVEEGVTGFAHFFEHMMFRGTEKYPAAVYDRIVNAMGADANAFTDNDLTCFHLSFSKDDLSKVIEIEADRFQNLNYAEEGFRTEAGAVYGEYRKGRSDAMEVLDEVVRDKAFEKHTYKHTTIGFEPDIAAMPTHYAYSKTFHQRFYRPENVVILVAGDIDPRRTMDMIRKEYGGWKQGYEAPKIPVEPPQTKEKRIDVPFEGRTLPILALNFKGEAFKPTDRAVVASQLIGELAFGETSPLYKKLVLDEQRVESLDASFDLHRDAGLWSVYARVKDPADVHAIEVLLWQTIDELARKPFSAERLADVRSNMRYGFLMRLDTPAQVASSLAPYIALTGDVADVEAMFHTLDQVTPDDVRRAAATWLKHDTCTVAILHDKNQTIPSTASASSPIGGTRIARTETSVDGKDPASQDIRFDVTDSASPIIAVRTGPQSVTQPPVLLSVPNDQTVAFKIWFQVGSQDDPPGKEGLAALVGHLIGEGATKSHSYSDILIKLFPLAASYRVSVDKEMTVVSGDVHKDNVDAFYPLLVDALRDPAFAKEDFERLRDEAISGIENGLRFRSGEELGKAALQERVYAGTPYGHIEAGTVESLKSITLDDVKGFWSRHFTRDAVVIGLGGAYRADLPERMQHDLGALQSGRSRSTSISTPAKVEGRRCVIVDNPSAIGSSISMGVPLDAKRGSKDFYALWIATAWLGQHRSSFSHLYQVIREERGINYGDYAYIQAFPRGGMRSKPPTGVGRRSQMFEVWLRTIPTKPDDLTLFTLRAGLREVEHLVANGMTKEQFDVARRCMRSYCVHFAESTGERLGYALEDRFYGVDGHLALFRKMMDEITLDDVNSAIKKHLHPENFTIAIVTNRAQAVKDGLASGAPSPMVYAGGVKKSDKTLAEDEEIASWPLHLSADRIDVVPVQSMFAGGTTRP